MIAFYVFSLVLGGGFLGLSLLGDLFGGHGDVDVGGMDIDADFDVDMDVDLHHDVDVDAGDLHGHPGGHLAAKIFSIRTVAYSLFGFGAVGTFLTWAWAGGSPVTTGVLASTTGLLSGALISTAFVWVRRSESGVVEGEDSYQGHTGRVVLPVTGTGGTIMVLKAGREIELRALPHASAPVGSDPALWKRVVVVEMEHGVARVAPLDNEPLLGS